MCSSIDIDPAYVGTDKESDDYVQFDPDGISPIIQNWIRTASPELLEIFPSSVQQMIIYFVLHFQFQSNNPVISTSSNIIKHEFSAIGSLMEMFGTVLFGKAFPSSTTVLSIYECHVKIKNKGRGIGIGIVPNDFNTFLYEHEYFPHHLTSTCVIFENGQFYGWDGQKQETEFKISDNDSLIIQINMKRKTMQLDIKGSEKRANAIKHSFVIKNLPNNSRLAFVLDARAEISVTSQAWKL